MGGAVHLVVPKFSEIFMRQTFKPCKNLNFWSVTSVGRLLTFFFSSSVGWLIEKKKMIGCQLGYQYQYQVVFECQLNINIY